MLDFSDRDCWGECCKDCEYKGHAYKPCRVCEEYYGKRDPEKQSEQEPRE